jgi:predicted CoA-binding protein
LGVVGVGVRGEEFVPADPDLAELLRRTRSVAVVGISDDPSRPSHDVAQYLHSHGYAVVPINPNLSEWEGLPAYADLTSAKKAGVPIEMVDVFRRPEHVASVVDEAIRVGARSVWLQLGVIDAASARRAKEAGLVVVMDRCSKIEHRRLVR